LCHCQHGFRFPAGPAARPQADLFRQRLALPARQVFEFGQQGRDGGRALCQRADRPAIEAQLAQVQAGGGSTPYGVDQAVIPHPSAIQIAAGNKESCVQAVFLQQRQGYLRIVRVTVVEGDAGRAWRQAAILQALQGLRQGQRREKTLEQS